MSIHYVFNTLFKVRKDYVIFDLFIYTEYGYEHLKLTYRRLDINISLEQAQTYPKTFKADTDGYVLYTR